MSYQTLAIAAHTLHTDEATLLGFAKNSWIETAEKRGAVFVDVHQQYKARYILHLRDSRHLTDEQISLVLSVQAAPYSAADVDRILASA